MLKIDQLKLSPEQGEDELRRKAAKILRVDSREISSLTVLRRSIDAREQLFLVYTVAVELGRESAVLARCRDRRVSAYTPT